MLFFLGCRGQGRLPGNCALTQTHDGLTLRPTDCACLFRRTQSTNRGGLSNPCGNENGHLQREPGSLSWSSALACVFHDRTEVMFRSGAKRGLSLRRSTNTLAHLCHLPFGSFSGQTPITGRRGLRRRCLYHTRRLGER